MKKDLIDKWLNNEATPADFEDLRTMPEFTSYLKIDKFVKRIEMPDFDVEAGLSELKVKLNTPKEPVKVLQLSNLLKIAAVLLVLLASFVFINSLPTEIDTKVAEVDVIALPDTSEVTINENSQLSFNKSSWAENREVFLEGEAYFEVAKGKVFDVTTNHGTISVLGTKFNVLSRENTFEVRCYEGLVSVTHNGNTIKLSKGNVAMLSNQTLNINQVLTSKPTWIYNESSYEDVAILDVLKELERRYNIQLTTKNINVNLHFTGTFSHDDLEAALQTITIPLELSYSIENKNEVTIFPKTSSE